VTSARSWLAAPAGRSRELSVSSQLSPAGKPLEAGTRRHFENHFGHDFSKVRVHADSAAASSARSVAAQAYTVGNDITFGAGMFNPNSQPGRKLLAHELTHVVQQENPSRTGAHESQHEAEAARASQQVIRGERASVGLAAPVSVQRQGLPGALPGDDVTQTASPLLASLIGSTSLEGFPTGKSDISELNETKLRITSDTILKLFAKYPASKIRVTGYTDAVGQESDNQALGQARADSVRAALVALGIPEIAIRTESKGAADLQVKTSKAEPRNRRVQVAFEPSTLLSGGLGKGLTVGPVSAQPTQPTGGGTSGAGTGDSCVKNPMRCHATGGDTGQPSVPAGVFKPIPDNTPYNRMDILGMNEGYTSHGIGPQAGGDLRQAWAQAYWKYKKLGLSDGVAAKFANSELSATIGKNESRDNPNTADQLDSQMKQAYPYATSVGPANVTLFKF